MSYSFTFESETFTTDELCNLISVEVNVIAHCDDDYSYEIESIYDEDAKCERPLESFSAKEQADIEVRAEKVAYENAHEAYQSYLEHLGDMKYDAWKDSQMEDGE